MWGFSHLGLGYRVGYIFKSFFFPFQLKFFSVLLELAGSKVEVLWPSGLRVCGGQHLSFQMLYSGSAHDSAPF